MAVAKKISVRPTPQSAGSGEKKAGPSPGGAGIRKVTVAKALPLVAPSPTDHGTGCLHCPLFCHHKDFARFSPVYGRDAEAIKSKLKLPHQVASLNVSERPWGKVDILFVGEAPGEKEDESGTPFDGASGKLLRGVVGKLMPNLKVAYTNVVRCRPPMNRAPSKSEIRACVPDLMREIQCRAPSVLVPLGNSSLSYLAGREGITAVAGCVISCSLPGLDGMKIVPCMHPAYILRANHEFDRFTSALETAAEVASGSYKKPKGEGEYYTVDTVEGVTGLLSSLKLAGDIVSCDSETGSLSPFCTKHPQLLCLSFSNEEGYGYTIPLDHKDSPWSIWPQPTADTIPELPDKPKASKSTAAASLWKKRNEEHVASELVRLRREVEVHNSRANKERPIVVKALAGFFSDAEVKKVFQNEKFDRKHIEHALKIELNGVVWDTMLVHSVLDDRPGTHGLEAMAYQLTGMGGYHREFDALVDSNPNFNPSKGGSYANIPGDVLFSYAAQDADATLRVLHRLLKDEQFTKFPKLLPLAKYYLMSLSSSLARIEYRGAKIDKSVVERCLTTARAKSECTQKAIIGLRPVQLFIADKLRESPRFELNLASNRQVGVVLWDYYKLQPLDLTDTGEDVVKARVKRAREEDPTASVEEYTKSAIKKREWDLFSTKADVLYEYASRKNQFAELLLDYREQEKLIGTYLEPLMDNTDTGGYIHGNFNIGGSITGRLSSSGPNLQNIPPSAKPAYVSRFPDGVLLQADLSQIELRIAACWYGDASMIAEYCRGEDVHRNTAIKIAGMTPTQFDLLPSAEQKVWRVRAKTVNFGIIYGITPAGIQRNMKKSGVVMELEEAEKLQKAFFQARPQLMRGIDSIHSFLKKYGYLESPTGRLRRIPEVFNDDPSIVSRALRMGGNAPIQCGAAEMTLMSLVLIDRELRRRKLRSVITVTVHDSIMVDATIEELVEVAKLVKDHMERIQFLSDSVLPGLDWKWLKVPVVAELEVGRSWGTAIEFDPSSLGGKPQSSKLWHIREDGEFINRDPVSIAELVEIIDQKHDYKISKI